EEQLVLFYRTAESAAELVALQNVLLQAVGIVKEGIRVQGVVAHVIVGGAVILIGSGFGDHADDAAGIAAILRAVIVRQNPEFVDDVRIRIQHDGVAEQVVVDAAIQKIRHRIAASAGNAEAPAAGNVRNHSGLEQGKVQNVSSIERHVRDLSSAD